MGGSASAPAPATPDAAINAANGGQTPVDPNQAQVDAIRQDILQAPQQSQAVVPPSEVTSILDSKLGDFTPPAPEPVAVKPPVNPDNNREVYSAQQYQAVEEAQRANDWNTANDRLQQMERSAGAATGANKRNQLQAGRKWLEENDPQYVRLRDAVRHNERIGKESTFDRITGIGPNSSLQDRLTSFTNFAEGKPADSNLVKRERDRLVKDIVEATGRSHAAVKEDMKDGRLTLLGSEPSMVGGSSSIPQLEPDIPILSQLANQAPAQAPAAQGVQTPAAMQQAAAANTAAGDQAAIPETPQQSPRYQGVSGMGQMVVDKVAGTESWEVALENLNPEAMAAGFDMDPAKYAEEVADLQGGNEPLKQDDALELLAEMEEWDAGMSEDPDAVKTIQHLSKFLRPSDIKTFMTSLKGTDLEDTPWIWSKDKGSYKWDGVRKLVYAMSPVFRKEWLRKQDQLAEQQAELSRLEAIQAAELENQEESWFPMPPTYNRRR
jgi:hypothetical protein